MQVNDDLKPVGASPGDGFLEIRQLALDVWLAGPNFKCPITDGQTNVVETSSSNGFKVGFGYPGIPMILKGGLRN